MTVTELRAKYAFHDSTINAIEWHPDENRFLLSLKLASDDQPSYHMDDPEFIHMDLIVTGVTKFTMQPAIKLFQVEDNVEGEVLKINIIEPQPEHTIDVWQLVCLIDDWNEHQSSWYTLTLASQDVQAVIRSEDPTGR